MRNKLGQRLACLYFAKEIKIQVKESCAPSTVVQQEKLTGGGSKLL